MLPNIAKPPARGGFVSSDLARLLRGRLRLGVLAAEALDAACRIHQLLFAGEERMARRANFKVDVTFVGRARYEVVSARTDHPDFLIVWMNTLLWHVSKNLSLQSSYFTVILRGWQWLLLTYPIGET
jgi:hypothetical protein